MHTNSENHRLHTGATREGHQRRPGCGPTDPGGVKEPGDGSLIPVMLRAPVFVPPCLGLRVRSGPFAENKGAIREVQNLSANGGAHGLGVGRVDGGPASVSKPVGGITKETDSVRVFWVGAHARVKGVT